MRNFLSKKKSMAIKLALAAGLCFTGWGQAQAAEFSEFFDWRLNNPADPASGANELSIVSPVELQKFGTCWTFGTMGSYESSWMKQMLAAQAAGGDVTPTRNIFSKYYLAWTTFMPPVDNSNDDSVHTALGADDLINLYEGDDRHPVYDQGGFVSNSVSGLLSYGAIDQNSLSVAKTEELKNAAARDMDTQATWDRINIFARNYLVTQYEKELKKTVKDETQRDSMIDAYRKSLTDADIEETAKKAFENATEQAVLSTVPAKGLLHDTYVTKDRQMDNNKYGLTDEQLENTKELIQTEGVVLVTHSAPHNEDKEYYSTYKTTGEVFPFYPESTHAETLVGWDDNYVFKNYANKDGSAIQGAFLMRNSWDTDYGVNGYGYLAYQDTSIADIAFFNAELDSKRYTINTTNAPALDKVDYIEGADVYATQNIANTFKADTDGGELLKAVTFFASENNMPYEIIVREGQTPGEGTILTKQSGTFGEDGNAKWAGYRTVDLDEFAFLAKDKNYTVEVRTTSPTGKTVYVALMAGQDVKMDGESYYYDEETKTWLKTDKMKEESNTEQAAAAAARPKSDGDVDDDTVTPTGYNNEILERNDYKQIYIFTAARNKESSEANGGDFTVSWLDDGGAEGSVIYLGKSDELYGSDPLNPSRTTLSNMTVNLAGGITNTYGGTITGEGGVTKTGYGSLRLTGSNAYTGDTTVNRGLLTINGSVAGDAYSVDEGVISGSGTIGGTLHNKNIAVAGDAGSGNLTMSALESEGAALASVATDGDNTKFVVNGAANIDGAKVSVTNAIPGDKMTVLTADSITGELAGPVATSGMMNTTASVAGSSIVAQMELANNLGGADSTQSSAYDAMAAMYSGFSADDSRRGEMRTLLNLDAGGAKAALSSIASNAAANSMAVAQKSSLMSRIISSRLTEAYALKNVSTTLPAMKLTDSHGKEIGDKNIEMPMMIDQPVDNSFWFKAGKNWGEMRGGASYHGTALAVGWDRAISGASRFGLFVSHGQTGLAESGASNRMKDTRFGLYLGNRSGASESFVYLDYGWMKNHLTRGISGLGLNTDAHYNGHILELGGEYKYDLSRKAESPWHIGPYINAQYSHMKQDGYSESGAGIYGQRVRSRTNNYFAGGLGFEFKRCLANGSYALRLGAKHAFSGANPRLSFGYAGDDAHSYEMRAEQDKTHFVLSIGGEAEFAPGWTLSGDAALERGSHDRDMMCALTLRRLW